MMEYAYLEPEEGFPTAMLKLGFWITNALFVFGFHLDAGTSSISYLRDIAQSDEEAFVPSAFYKMGWLEHDDEETYPY